jgi:hypothetical protein
VARKSSSCSSDCSVDSISDVRSLTSSLTRSLTPLLALHWNWSGRACSLEKRDRQLRIMSSPVAQ